MLLFQDAGFSAADGLMSKPALPAGINRPDLKKVQKFFSPAGASAIKKLCMRRAEKLVRNYLATKGIVVGKDWSLASIDWQAVLKFLITVLPLILALFGA